MAVWRFPGWELHPRRRLLLVQGEPARIGTRAFDLLLALVERHGEVVTKDELLSSVWRGLVVEENNLTVQVAALRRLIGAGAIVNQSGVGYRLADQPESVSTDAGTASPPVPGPAPPGLIGRDADLQTLAPQLGQVPLLSIVGPGGVGKTALARALVARRAGGWRDGVHWLDLAPVPQGALLLPLFAKTLGMALEASKQETPEELMRSLPPLDGLIVLDNCEHLIDEVASLVAPALRAAPGLRWLATSQEPLHLPGEMTFRLETLQLPPQDAPLPEAMRSGALALFCDRARAVDHRFGLVDEDLPAALEICRQLDGLPLAIEMAAARVATLGLRGLQDQLERRLTLRAGVRGAPSRHHTLLQTFDWSYGLLAPAERLLFRRLAPLVDGFGTELVLRMCSEVPEADGGMRWDPDLVLETLSALVDKSLVQRRAGVPERFFLLESARAYARLQLEPSGELDLAQRSHAEAVAAWFDRAHVEFHRMRDSEWGRQCLPERYNVRAALGWACTARQPALLARLVAALAHLDAFAQAPAEVVQIDLPLAVLEAAPTPLRARAWLELGWAHHLDGNRETGTELVRRSLADFEASGDTPGTYLALVRLVRLYQGRPGTVERAREIWQQLDRFDEQAVPLRLRLVCAITVGFRFDQARAIERLQELHDLAERAGFSAQAAVARANITHELCVQGRFAEVVDVTRDLLEGAVVGPRSRAMMWHNCALALVQLRRIEEAREAARATLLALPSAAYAVVDLFALAAARSGQLVDAALMVGYSARVKRERDIRPAGPEAAVIQETVERLNAALGVERLAQLSANGASLSTADALAIALSAGAKDAPEPAPGLARLPGP